MVDTQTQSTLQQMQAQIDQLSQSANKPIVSQQDTKINLIDIPQGPGSLLNGDMIDGIHATTIPMPSNLLPLGPKAQFPISVIPTAGSGSGFLLGNGMPTDKNILVADGSLWQSRTMSGDASITADTGTLTLANTAVTAGTYGDSTHAAQFTVDSKGRITAASSNAFALPAGVSGDIQFNGGSNNFAADANLFWDNTNKRLSIGTGNSPQHTLDITSANNEVYTALISGNRNGARLLKMLATTGPGYCVLEANSSGASGSCGYILSQATDNYRWQLALDGTTGSEGEANSLAVYSYDFGDYTWGVRPSDLRVHVHHDLLVSGNSTLSGTTNNVGTITTGTWNGSIIGSTYGGTNADLHTSAQGAIPFFHSTGTMSSLAAGTSGQVLQTNGASADPSFVSTLSSLVQGNITSLGTVTSGTISGLTVILPNTDPTTNGSIGYDQTNKQVVVGDGSNAQKLSLGAWLTWTVTFTGFSSNPTGYIARYAVYGKTVVAFLQSFNGTSNSGSFTITLPVNVSSAAAAAFAITGFAQDNGVVLNSLLRGDTAGNSTTVTLYASPGGAGWTSSGNKGCCFTFVYESA